MSHARKLQGIEHFGRRNPSAPGKVGYPKGCLPETIAGRTVDDIHVTTGILAYEAGRFQEAVGFFKNALSENGKNATAYMYVGMMQRDLGRVENDMETMDMAILMLTRSIALEGNSPQAHVERCKAYAYMNAWEDAKADARRAIEIDPDYAPAYLWLGIYQAHKERPGDAIALMSKYFELAPWDVENREKFAAYRDSAVKAVKPEPAPVGCICKFTSMQTTDGAVAFIMRFGLLTTQRDGPEY